MNFLFFLIPILRVLHSILVIRSAVINECSYVVIHPLCFPVLFVSVFPLISYRCVHNQVICNFIRHIGSHSEKNK